MMHDQPASRLMQVKFWLLVLLSVPSAFCSVFILIYFYYRRRKLAICHHLTLVLVTTSFLQVTTELPLSVAYYRRGRVIPASNGFCIWWNWWDFALQGTIRFAMAWGSVERHFLVFNSRLMICKWNRLLFHILPMVIACAYIGIFYFAVIVVNSCKNHWNFNTVLCLQPCYSRAQPTVASYDWIGNIVFPFVVTTVANISLILRVLWQKRRHHSVWRRQRKLIFQIVIVAVIYMLFWFPMAFTGLWLLFWFSPGLMQVQVGYFVFLLYLASVLLPFILLFTLPELKRKWFGKRHRFVVPCRYVGQGQPT